MSLRGPVAVRIICCVLVVVGSGSVVNGQAFVGLAFERLEINVSVRRVAINGRHL